MQNKGYLDNYWSGWGRNQTELHKHTKEGISENDVDLDKGNETMCGACSLPIFSTPYSQKDHHFFHKCCAQLSPVLMDHSLHPKHPLHLHDELLDDDYRRDIICNNCREQCKGFFYQCRGDECRFTLDIQCAITIKIAHRSHKHELTLIPAKRGNVFTCGACGLEGRDEFYCCYFCNFYLHRDCAVLPNTILHTKHADIDGQQHPLTLTFVLPMGSFKYMKSKCCSLCHEELSSIKSGVYFCMRCDYAAHIKCAISKPSDFRSGISEQIVGDLPHFPMKNEDINLIQYLQEKGGIISDMKRSESIEEKKLHDHELILQQHLNQNENENGKCICNACTDPIIITNNSLPFYTCTTSQCSTNHFYLHQSCSNLPFSLQHPLHHCKREGREYSCKDDSLVLCPTYSSGREFPKSTVFCYYGCEKNCNGFVYSCEKCNLKLDVKCAALPDVITYELHSKSHILFLSYDEITNEVCNCCGYRIYYCLFYRCSSCPNFTIDVRCVLLPSSVSHKYDRHPLKLTRYEESSTPRDGDIDFCEICEKGMHTGQWLYHCKECITSFHIECIPCVGWGSKFKFGGSIRVRCHDCPLICMRRLNNYSRTCGHCNVVFQGKQETYYYDDDVAFECTKCGFWLDYRCAYGQWIRE